MFDTTSIPAVARVHTLEIADLECHGLNFAPSKLIVEVMTPGTSEGDCTAFAHRISNEVISNVMSLG